MNQLDDKMRSCSKTPKPHNVAAVTEDGRRLPFNVLQEVYQAYFWFFKRCEEYFLVQLLVNWN